MPFNKFNRYPNRVFIETGSYFGDGIQSALDSGFQSIFSIELTEKYYKHCTNRFRANSRVHTVNGDCATKLEEVIADINESITFYLDGHWDTGATDETRGVEDYPVIRELEAIAKHPIKTHTILIDDVRLFDEWGVGHGNIINKLLEINPDYVISYEDGLADRANDVLVAKI